MSIDVEVDAQSIGDKAKQKNNRNGPKVEDPFTAEEAYGNGTRSGKDPFDHDDLKRIFGGKSSCAVVFNTPADAGEQHKQRACIESKT